MSKLEHRLLYRTLQIEDCALDLSRLIVDNEQLLHKVVEQSVLVELVDQLNRLARRAKVLQEIINPPVQPVAS